MESQIKAMKWAINQIDKGEPPMKRKLIEAKPFDSYAACCENCISLNDDEECTGDHEPEGVEGIFSEPTKDHIDMYFCEHRRTPEDVKADHDHANEDIGRDV